VSLQETSKKEEEDSKKDTNIDPTPSKDNSEEVTPSQDKKEDTSAKEEKEGTN